MDIGRILIHMATSRPWRLACFAHRLGTSRRWWPQRAVFLHTCDVFMRVLDVPMYGWYLRLSILCRAQLSKAGKVPTLSALQVPVGAWRLGARLYKYVRICKKDHKDGGGPSRLKVERAGRTSDHGPAILVVGPGAWMCSSNQQAVPVKPGGRGKSKKKKKEKWKKERSMASPPTSLSRPSPGRHDRGGRR